MGPSPHLLQCAAILAASPMPCCQTAPARLRSPPATPCARLCSCPRRASLLAPHKRARAEGEVTPRGLGLATSAPACGAAVRAAAAAAPPAGWHLQPWAVCVGWQAICELLPPWVCRLDSRWRAVQLPVTRTQAQAATRADPGCRLLGPLSAAAPPCQVPAAEPGRSCIPWLCLLSCFSRAFQVIGASNRNRSARRMAWRMVPTRPPFHSTAGGAAAASRTACT